jgi:hypothetical protein
MAGAALNYLSDTGYIDEVFGFGRGWGGPPYSKFGREKRFFRGL